MSNTIIQIKRSSSVEQPANAILSVAEPAYSFLSDKLFIGNTTQGAIAIGGKFFIDQQNTIFNAVNAAFSQANTISSDADEKANAAIITANAAYDKANSANILAYQIGGALNGVNTTVAYANSAWDKANAANLLAYHIGGALDGVNTTVAYANSAWDKANAANLLAYHIGGAVSGLNTTVQIANAAFDSSNSVNSYSDGTYVKLTASTQTVTGNLSITGSLTVSGNAYRIDANTLFIQDPLIYLAGNNYISDSVDIGFVGNYVNTSGINVHTGLFRSHITKEYYLFQGYDQEPDFNKIDLTGNNFTIAVLNADLVTNNLWVSGYNTAPWITAAFAKGNAAHLTANAAFNVGNTAQYIANLAFDKANTGGTISYAAFDAANAAYDKGNAAHLTANVAYDKANAANILAYHIGGALDGVNTTVAYANSAWDKANAANLLAYETLQSSYNASNLSTGTVPSGRLTGSYSGITGIGTLVSGTWNADVITVPYGGTGATSHTNNYVLLGNTTGAIKSVGSTTEGHVLQINSSNIPQFAMLDGGIF